MQIIKNERGAALLTVFFILILFMILGLSIAWFTLQSSKQRAFAEDEIQGKLLADMGFAYFQEYTEAALKGNISAMPDKVTILNALESPSPNDEIITRLRHIAGFDGKYKLTQISETANEGAFAIGVMDKEFLKYQDGSEENEPSQPYVRELEVTVIGIPPRATTEGAPASKRMKVTATVYLNTIPAPFHYALHSADEVRLFGGSNILGNVASKKTVVTTNYIFKEEEVWETPNTIDVANRPYIEGKVILPTVTTGDSLALYDISDSSTNNLTKTTDPGNNTEKTDYGSLEDDQRVEITREDLKKTFVVNTLNEEDASKSSISLSAPADKAYLPGYEPPRVEANELEDQQLFSEGQSLNAIFTAIKNRNPSPNIIVPAEGKPIVFEAMENQEYYTDQSGAITSCPEPPCSEALVIRSEQSKPEADAASLAPLTVRLTGTAISDQSSIKEIYILPAGTDKSVTVEMGRKGAFKEEQDDEGEPFTFNGSIYIEGNLDILEDININGTIYVDGNVIIREATNRKPDSDTSDISDTKNNLAIVSSGTIQIADRYSDTTSDDWKLVDRDDDHKYRLAAFLFSEKQIEVYSITSFNWIDGGIASKSFIELNTRRENTNPALKENKDDYLASRLTVQFNPGIFEKETPGLPPGNKFFLDIYNLQYASAPDTLTYEK